MTDTEDKQQALSYLQLSKIRSITGTEKVPLEDLADAIEEKWREFTLTELTQSSKDMGMYEETLVIEIDKQSTFETTGYKGGVGLAGGDVKELCQNTYKGWDTGSKE